MENIANSGEHGSLYATRNKVTECVQKYGFTTTNKNKSYGSTGMSCGIFPEMSFEEFCAHMKGYRGKDGNDFKNKVAQDYANQLQLHQQQPQQLNQIQRLSNFPVNTNTDTTGDSSEKMKVIIGGIICAVAILIAAIFLFRSIIGGGNPMNSKNAVIEIQYFTPTQLSGLTIGEMFDGACMDGDWATYEVKDSDSLFGAATTWVRFSGNSDRGAINATFTITKDSMLDYTCYVDGNPVLLEEMYRMFHDPDYDKKLSEATEAADNEAKFDAAEEKIQKMDFVHNYIVADFNGMTILEFIDSVCRSGDWSSNNKTDNLRVVFEGQSELGMVQAIFDVDENLGTVDGSWYFSSREIAAIDLYQKFYPKQKN